VSIKSQAQAFESRWEREEYRVPQELGVGGCRGSVGGDRELEADYRELGADYRELAEAEFSGEAELATMGQVWG